MRLRTGGASPVSTRILPKNETGRLDPVSVASVEMRLHHSTARLAWFTSAWTSRASKGFKRSEDATLLREHVLGQSWSACDGFSYFLITKKMNGLTVQLWDRLESVEGGVTQDSFKVLHRVRCKAAGIVGGEIGN